MTMAGESAGTEARRQRRLEAEHLRYALAAGQKASHYEVADRTESETAKVLAPRAGIG